VLHNTHITHYEQGNCRNEAVTVRKLLLHRHEIDKLIGKTREKGQTLVPTKMYLKNGRVKVEIALAKGKQNYDKRETIKKREADAEAKAAIMRARRS
jgi:SsrA-binding protein